MNNFEEKLKEIINKIYVNLGGIHAQGKEITSKDLDNETEKAIDQIKQLISETIGERKSVEELVIPDAMTDLASKVCFKEGYNTKLKELRHAFNLKGE